MRRERHKLLVVGLDALSPEKLFREWREELPTFSSLAAQGVWGRLESCHPPITVPAWSCVFTGRDPGELGCYGFRTRTSYSYGTYDLASSRSVPFPRVWDRLGRRGFRSLLVGVPQTYPAPEIRGEVVSCFLTPPGGPRWTFPASLAEEVSGRFGSYRFDVEGFRSAEYPRILREVYEKTRKDFDLVRYLCATRRWDLCVFVEIAVDRLQHAFWAFCDPGSDRFDPEGSFRWVLRDYYRFLDEEMAKLLEVVGPDTSVLVLSDHGARRMEGGVCLNDWLAARGLLRLRETPRGATEFRPELVDWRRTVAWADGGYCGRVYLNVRGREPCGYVARTEYERVRSEVAAALRELETAEGGRLETSVHTPEELYRTVRGPAPDLLAYFGDLGWRVIGSVGHGTFRIRENDRGPDGANHDWFGSWVYRPCTSTLGGREIEGWALEAIHRLILSEFGLEENPLGGSEAGDREPPSLHP